MAAGEDKPRQLTGDDHHHHHYFPQTPANVFQSFPANMFEAFCSRTAPLAIGLASFPPNKKLANGLANVQAETLLWPLDVPLSE